jgi:hypothetical protein
MVYAIMKTAERITSQVAASDEQRLAGFIEKFDSKNAPLIRLIGSRDISPFGGLAADSLGFCDQSTHLPEERVRVVCGSSVLKQLPQAGVVTSANLRRHFVGR